MTGKLIRWGWATDTAGANRILIVFIILLVLVAIAAPYVIRPPATEFPSEEEVEAVMQRSLDR